MSISKLRGALRKAGEIVKLALPLGGATDEGTMELVSSDIGRLRAHFAFKVGGPSKVGTVSGTSASLTFTAGTGKILRVLSDADVFIRIDQPTGTVAADPASDGVSMYLPLGETAYLVIPDASQDAVLSFLQVTAGGSIWANAVE